MNRLNKTVFTVLGIGVAVVGAWGFSLTCASECKKDIANPPQVNQRLTPSEKTRLRFLDKDRQERKTSLPALEKYIHEYERPFIELEKHVKESDKCYPPSLSMDYNFIAVKKEYHRLLDLEREYQRLRGKERP